MKDLLRKIRLLITRGVVQRVNSAGKLQSVQVELLSEELLDGVEYIEPYGFTSTPKAGAECLAVAVNGSRANTVLLSIFDRRFRLKNLVSGEVAIYTDEGDVIHFKRGGDIAITAAASVTVTAPLVTISAATKCTIDSPVVEITGDLLVAGSAAITGGLTAATVADSVSNLGAMRTTYNGHNHNPGSPTTSAPNQSMS